MNAAAVNFTEIIKNWENHHKLIYVNRILDILKKVRGSLILNCFVIRIKMVSYALK